MKWVIKHSRTGRYYPDYWCDDDGYTGDLCGASLFKSQDTAQKRITDIQRGRHAVRYEAIKADADAGLLVPQAVTIVEVKDASP